MLDENQISKAADKKVAVIDKEVKEPLDLRNSLLKIIPDYKKGCCSPNLEDDCPLFVLD